ncbi:MAG: CPXCG motif-containing cysteine-rich protein [Verrucomicrobiota bacterium]
MELVSVICPACFETFEVASLPPSECPTEIDYDCEICCRPMVIAFDLEFGDVSAEARSIHD